MCVEEYDDGEFVGVVYGQCLCDGFAECAFCVVGDGGGAGDWCGWALPEFFLLWLGGEYEVDVDACVLELLAVAADVAICVVGGFVCLSEQGYEG